VNIKVTDADKDKLLSIALDAGADDVLEPNFDDDDDDSEEEIERYLYSYKATNIFFGCNSVC
jgi:hypothetical protein